MRKSAVSTALAMLRVQG